MLPRAIVVRGADDERVARVGAMEGADQEIATGLRCRVRGGRLERRALGERAGLDRAVDLVSRDLEVADSGRSSGVEEHEGAEDIGLDEIARRLDRSVDVRLSGEVDDRVDPIERGRDGIAVGDVPLDEVDAVAIDSVEVLPAAGIGELVEDPHRLARVVVEPQADVGRADEPGPSGHKDHWPAASSVPRPGAAGFATSSTRSRSARYAANPRRHSGRRRARWRSLPSTE